MRKCFALILAIMSVVFASYGQVVLTEISYNPPESGTDTLEYLELYNSGANALNLKDYKFTKGIDFTFPDSILGSKKYVLVVKNAKAFKKVYNINAFDWSPLNALSTSNTLSNSGEIVELSDASGNIFFSFKYDKVAPWPTFADGTDGAGGSIEICKPDADPALGSNWKVSLNDLGFELNSKKVFGTPGKANSITDCVATPDQIVEVSSNVFTPKDITINVGQTVRWVNKGGSHNINGTKTTFPNNPDSFGNGSASSSAWTYDFKFTKEGKYDYQCDPHASLGMKGTVTVKSPVVVDVFPLRTITQMTSTNADGKVDSLDAKCTLKGIVYGVNLRPAGLQFTIIDNQNNGIGAFLNSGNLNYTVKEGDEVEIKGAIAQFNGFTQMALSEIKLIAQNKPLVSTKSVTSFNELDESSLITLRNVTFADPLEWTGTGSGFNVTMKNASQQSFTIRIDNDIDAFVAPIPAGSIFSVTGLLGQFDATSPYNEGYQLLPRYLVDFSPAGSVENVLDSQMTVQPNPSNDLLNIITDTEPERLELFNVQGQKINQYFNTLSIDMSPFSNGVYFVKAVKGEKSSTVRIVKM